jgi:hypothetical protein
MQFASEKIVWIAWRFAVADSVPNLAHTNDFTGSFVTSGARIHLYGYLDRLGDRALYCDTDSITYVQPRDQPSLVETGDRLGAVTSELAPKSQITEFVSGGPKNYAFKTIVSVTGANNTTCKIRGLTLNFSASQVVNFEKLRNMILNRDRAETVTVHTGRQIKRKRCEECVRMITEPADKN